jgi:hypothetical protein
MQGFFQAPQLEARKRLGAVGKKREWSIIGLPSLQVSKLSGLAELAVNGADISSLNGSWTEQRLNSS